LFAGPIIAREILTAPRPPRFYVSRASYAGLLFILMWTAWQLLVGWQDTTELGLIARFGAILFQMFARLQLTLMLFFAPLAAATAVAHEKDRRTFVLLLMTDLSDLEIVLGKLLASLLQIVTLLLASAPVYFLCVLLGGVSPIQVVEVLAVTAAAGVAGGCLGLLVALARDRTFQSLAMTVLAIVLGLALIEAGLMIAPGAQVAGVTIGSALNPFRTMMAIVSPDAQTLGQVNRASLFFIVVATLASLGFLGFGVLKLRVWNPSGNEPRETLDEPEEALESLVELVPGSTADPVATTSDPVEVGATTGLHVPRRSHRRLARPAGPYRRSWDNPILWRELMTRAYGSKPLLIKAAYLLCMACGVAYFYANPNLDSDPWRPAKALLPLAVLSLILINAQGVTALTSERDTGALDLLLVTEVSPKEFIYGKLYGVLYNAKEMVVGPLIFALWLAARGYISGENALFISIDFLLLTHFAAMLGLHAAITYTNSRASVAHSLGTIFFLMVGIGLCAFLILQSKSGFGRQLLSFMIFIGAGSVALFGSLGSKNPSQAIFLVALLTPFWSFYCVISLMEAGFMAAFLFSVGVYGFALLAMLVPAVSDFDIALGRTNAIQG
jgi:ABC-type Na+ efflux pump permease subunit